MIIMEVFLKIVIVKVFQSDNAAILLVLTVKSPHLQY